MLTYAYERREAWLFDGPGEHDDGTTYPMCGPHADGVTIPIGWILHDRRSAHGPAVGDVA
jgi:hypothetical protein